MKKLISLLAIIAMMLCVFSANADETGKSLIFYYDYSENIDTTGLDVDAISQASMAGVQGRDKSNILLMTEILKERTDAEVYALHVDELYPAEFNEMADIAKKQRDQGTVLAFQEALPDFSSYDVIYFGTPVWWFGAPQAILTVLQQADFGNAKIVFFGIHGGSGFAGIPDAIQQYQSNVTIVDRFTVASETDNDEVRTQFNAFLDQIAW